MSTGWYFAGVDIGQAQDFTAIAVVERAELVGAHDPVVWAYRKEVSLRLRYMERVPLGTSYPEVVRRIVELARSPQLAGRCHIAMDATGVGRPVVDLLRASRPGCGILPALVTGGMKETRDGQFHHIPKRELITRLQVLLQSGRLQIASKLKGAEELVAEMAAMRVRVTASGNEQMGSWRDGSHDDLVFAVALACWAAGKIYPQAPSGEGAYWQFPLAGPANHKAWIAGS